MALDIIPKGQIKHANQSDARLMFESVLNQMAQIFLKNGRSVVTFHDKSLKVFSKLSVEMQKKVSTDARVYLETLELFEKIESETKATDLAINQGYQMLLWAALKYFGLRPTSDLFGYLTEDKIVEVYDAQGLQIWRNFNFFSVCGYSLEEMFCYTWMERYERNDEVMLQIGALMSRLVSGDRETIHCGIHNQLRELKSSEKLIIDAHHEFISPLYNSYNAYSGFVVISSAKLFTGANQAASSVVSIASNASSDINLM